MNTDSDSDQSIPTTRAGRQVTACCAFIAAVLLLPDSWLVAFALLLVAVAIGLPLIWFARMFANRWDKPMASPLNSDQQRFRQTAGALSFAASAVWLFVGSASLAMMRVYVPHPEYRVYHEDGLTALGPPIRIVLAAGALTSFGLMWGLCVVAKRGAKRLRVRSG
jgi:hypothetical protein